MGDVQKNIEKVAGNTYFNYNKRNDDLMGFNKSSSSDGRVENAQAILNSAVTDMQTQGPANGVYTEDQANQARQNDLNTANKFASDQKRAGEITSSGLQSSMDDANAKANSMKRGRSKMYGYRLGGGL